MSQVVERPKPVSPQVAHYSAEYRRSVSQAAAQPRWVAQARESAIAQFERLGFPTTKLEHWRFTSVAPIAERIFRSPSDGATGMDATLVTALAAPAAVAVCVNGRFSPELSRLDRLPKGIQILGLEDALASNPGLIEPCLGEALVDADQRIHFAEYRVSA